MGYYYTADPENAVLPKSWAPLKTHGPGSPVKERGRRFYMPILGRWMSRDPIEEKGGVNLFTYALNNAECFIDYLGECVKTLTVDRSDPKNIKVDIVFRVYWMAGCGDGRNLEKQKDMDKAAEGKWSGKFSKTTGMLWWRKVLYTYHVRVKVDSSYKDAGDSEPAEPHTTVWQMDTTGRANATLALHLNQNQMITLYRGDRRNEYSHEVGHTMGNPDHYHDVWDFARHQNVSEADIGWGSNIMGSFIGVVDYRNIEYILNLTP